jgi:hypothetical protein
MLKRRSTAAALQEADRNIDHLLKQLLPEFMQEGLLGFADNGDEIIYMVSSHLESPGVTWLEFREEILKGNSKQLEAWRRSMVLAENEVIEKFERGTSQPEIECYLASHGLNDVISVTSDVDELRSALQRAHACRNTYADYNPYEIPSGILIHVCVGYSI